MPQVRILLSPPFILGAMMLDIVFIRENPDVVKRACLLKNIDISIDLIIELDKKLRSIIHQTETLRAERNTLTTEFSRVSSDEHKQALRIKVSSIKETLATLESESECVRQQLKSLLLQVPAIPWSGAPQGNDDSSNVVIRKCGQLPSFAFPVRDHVELMELNDWADFSRVANVSGSRTYILKGRLALLEQSLLLFAAQQMMRRGFTPVSVPSIAREQALTATGHFPAGREDVFEIERDVLFLTGTAEVILTSLHTDEILSVNDLPLKYSGISPCFRREAGSAGRDVRGLMRVHQFNKVEQFIISPADMASSEKYHAELLANAEYLMTELEIPYQVLECSTGDMGAGKFRQNDIEAWIPSFNGYRETHSCSSLLDWQARRANLRYRDDDGKVRYAHTLNNTAIATPRIFVSLLENRQTEDGRVKIPACLRSFFDGDIYL